MSVITSKTDIVIAIRPQHVANIVSRTKDHEYRKYLIPSHVKRFWIYETKPASAITYVATISPGKKPGEIRNQNGLRNQEFNEGRLSHLANYAYEILSLEKLEQPVTLQDLTSKGWLGGPPQKYCYIKDSMMRVLRTLPTIPIFTPEAAGQSTVDGAPEPLLHRQAIALPTSEQTCLSDDE